MRRSRSECHARVRGIRCTSRRWCLECRSVCNLATRANLRLDGYPPRLDESRLMSGRYWPKPSTLHVPTLLVSCGDDRGGSIGASLHRHVEEYGRAESDRPTCSSTEAKPRLRDPCAK